jgi:hypothetical protein
MNVSLSSLTCEYSVKGVPGEPPPLYVYPLAQLTAARLDRKILIRNLTKFETVKNAKMTGEVSDFVMFG